MDGKTMKNFVKNGFLPDMRLAHVSLVLIAASPTETCFSECEYIVPGADMCTVFTDTNRLDFVLVRVFSGFVPGYFGHRNRH